MVRMPLWRRSARVRQGPRRIPQRVTAGHPGRPWGDPRRPSCQAAPIDERVLGTRRRLAIGLDWAAAVSAAASSVVIVVVVFAQGGVGMGAMPPGALIVFLGVVAWFTGRHLFRFIWPSQNPNAWWFAHMSAMTDAFISTVTAFSVTAMALFFGVPVSWSWAFFIVPLVVGILAQRLWMYSYQRQFRRGIRPADVATVRVAGAEGDRL